MFTYAGTETTSWPADWLREVERYLHHLYQPSGWTRTLAKSQNHPYWSEWKPLTCDRASLLRGWAKSWALLNAFRRPSSFASATALSRSTQLNAMPGSGTDFEGCNMYIPRSKLIEGFIQPPSSINFRAKDRGGKHVGLGRTTKTELVHTSIY